MERFTTAKSRVMVIEERELFRYGLLRVFEGEGFILAAAYDSDGFLRKGDQEVDLEPGTVVLCSLTLPGWRELVQQLLLREPNCLILGVADQITDELVVEALARGILDCIDRSQAPVEWVKAVQDVPQQKRSAARTMIRYPAVARRVLMLLSKLPEPLGLEPLAPVLGDRERSALAHLSERVPLEMIIDRMGISEQNLYELLDSACRKLVARHRLSALVDQLR